MTRTNAREIVAQLVYEMGFRDDDARTLVREHLDPDYYATLKDESDAYEESPSGKQVEYIQSTVCGIREKQDELDGYISKYAIGWNLGRSPRRARHHAAGNVRMSVRSRRAGQRRHQRGGRADAEIRG